LYAGADGGFVTGWSSEDEEWGHCFGVVVHQLTNSDWIQMQ
jgi:hypothetical protein